MGAPGSAWIKPKKRGGLRPEALRNLPHPIIVRPGQRYFPRQRRGHSRATLCVTRVPPGAESCQAKREDAEQATVSVKLARLLAVDGEGQGRYYRFVGYRPGRGYPTHAHILETDEHWVRMVCPEWHPELVVTVSAGSVPPYLRVGETWVACRADLGADAPARVNPRAFAPAQPGFDAEVYLPVRARPSAAASSPVPAAGLGPIILFAATPEPSPSPPRVYLTGHPPPVRAGDRVLLASAGEVRAAAVVHAVRRRPNGTELELDAGWTSVAGVRAPPPPTSGFDEGRYGRQNWVLLDEGACTPE